ncbi:MAG: hypothetical protein M3270_10580 [Thermoproteota archaeon]|nr:hypothetical protein [Thermoproteota archaeon]
MEEPKGESYHRNVVLYGILTVFLQNVIKRILGFLHPLSSAAHHAAQLSLALVSLLFYLLLFGAVKGECHRTSTSNRYNHCAITK